ncbi:MAG: AMP-binding protein, partial [bacterium]|nr:AMP-binding protein [bacterium]
MLQKTPFSFDVSVWEFFWPLIVGARLVVARPGGDQDGAYLARVVAEEEVTTLHLVPSMLQVFLDQPLAACDPRTGGPLRRVIASGEALPYALQERFFERLGAELHNLYGPTEAAVDVTWWRCERGRARRSVPIGRPIANTCIHLLDRDLAPVPPPVAGELHIGGVGLARGYVGRPDLTAERFVPDPFRGEPGARLYKTGDLARYGAGGAIEFLGRIDHQVQLRGFRIELGEIEAILGRSPGVRECAVLARERRPGDLHLTAYLVAETATGQEELHAFLQENLPEHMIPSTFEFLDALPLNPSGKVDRLALARRAVAEPEPTAPFAAPADPDEELLAAIWVEVLDRERVGVHDNFFELGGHSLLATQVVSRIREALGVAVPVQRLFEVPTVAGLAGVVHRLRREERGIAAPPMRPVSHDRELPLSFAQQRLWFLDQLEPGSSTYNIPAAVRLGGALAPALLERVFHEVVHRHEALRTTFTATAGRPHQVIAAQLEVPLPLVELDGLPASARAAEARRLAEAEALCPFDLTAGPLVRGTLLRLQEEDHVVLVNMHHIVSDGWSIGLFLREVAQLYTAARGDQPAPLPPLPLQYADFAHWQRGWLVGEVLETHLRYWREQLAGAPARLELPADRPRPAVQTFSGRTLPVVFDEPLSAALAGLGRRRRVTLFMTLMAAFQALLSRYSGHTDVVVGTPIAGRNYQEIEALIGFFVNTLVLRTDLAGRPSFDELLARVRRVALDAYAHQELPFEHLVEELRPQRDLSSTPLFQVMFIFQNAPRAALEFSGLTLTPMPTEAATAKFDLTLTLEERASGIGGSFEYNTDLFDDVTIRRLAAHFRTLLAAVARDPARPVAEVALLSASEHHQLCR